MLYPQLLCTQYVKVSVMAKESLQLVHSPNDLKSMNVFLRRIHNYVAARQKITSFIDSFFELFMIPDQICCAIISSNNKYLSKGTKISNYKPLQHLMITFQMSKQIATSVHFSWSTLGNNQ